MVKLKSYKDIVNEMSIAREGDWDGGSYLAIVDSDEIRKKYNLIDNINIDDKTLEIRQLRNSLVFKIGYYVDIHYETKIGIETKERFIVISRIDLTRNKSIEKIGYKKVINVDGVIVSNDYRRSGIATYLYKLLIHKLHYSIQGDRIQYKKARQLWAKLSKQLDLQVDLVNIKTKEIVEHDIILHHGSQDNDFDERLWSYGEDKEYIRPILTKIL